MRLFGMHFLECASSLDIGANLVDDMFRGIYRGKQVHAPDLRAVLERARKAGITDIMITASHAEDTCHAIRLIEQHGDCGGTNAIHSFIIASETDYDGGSASVHCTGV